MCGVSTSGVCVCVCVCVGVCTVHTVSGVPCKCVWCVRICEPHSQPHFLPPPFPASPSASLSASLPAPSPPSLPHPQLPLTWCRQLPPPCPVPASSLDSPLCCTGDGLSLILDIFRLHITHEWCITWQGSTCIVQYCKVRYSTVKYCTIIILTSVKKCGHIRPHSKTVWLGMWFSKRNAVRKRKATISN